VRAYHLGYGIIPGDAVTAQILEIDRRLQGWGFETRIFAEHVAPEYRQIARPDEALGRLLRDQDALLIYHYSIYTPNARMFRAFDGPKVLVYHNITPARYFYRWDLDQARLCAMGRHALGTLRRCDLALGISEYNRRELVEAGFEPACTGVLPFFVQFQDLASGLVDERLAQDLRTEDRVNWLSVGRIVPNKAVEDVIRTFYIYHRYIEPRSRLFLVGSRYVPAYDAQLDALIEALSLSDAVVLTGRVSPAELRAYYQAADLFMTASHHEGFCVPLIESMFFGVPVLARSAAAVPETLLDAGVLYKYLGYVEAAEMAHLLVDDRDVRAQVIAGQRARLQVFAPEIVEQRLWEVLQRVGVV
jgi:glycosyltransferase involved in cell wall biosynthesis